MASPPKLFKITHRSELDTNWTQTYLGRKFYFFDPKPEDIFIEDIVKGLANKCRFAGQCEYYSVAQHSVLVSLIVPKIDSLWALLHDAGEAYLFDAPHPYKVNRPILATDEKRILKAVAKKFGLKFPIPESVKEADLIALSTEHRDIMHCRRGIRWSTDVITPLNTIITPWSSVIAEQKFRERFLEITKPLESEEEESRDE